MQILNRDGKLIMNNGNFLKAPEEYGMLKLNNNLIEVRNKLGVFIKNSLILQTHNNQILLSSSGEKTTGREVF